MRIFLRLFGFLRPYRAGAVWSLVLAALAMVVTAALPTLTGRAIDRISEGDKGGLRWIALIIVVAAAARLVLSATRRLVAGKVSLGVEVDMREALYAHLLRLDMGFFDNQQTGQLMSRATVDLQSVRFFLGYGLVFITQSALTIGLAAVAMIALQPGLGLLALIPTPFVVVIANRYGRVSQPAQREVQQRIAELTADVQENVSGVRVVKAFAREDRQRDRFAGSAQRVFDQSLIATRQRAFYNPLLAFLPQLGLAVILLVGGRKVIDGTLTTGEFAAFYTYVLMLVSPMRLLGVALGMAQRASASGARLFEILDTEPNPVVPDGLPELPAGRGRVEFDGVTFGYGGTRRPALTDVSLTVAAGRTVALVGGTGSGKSSLIGLIPRLYDADTGAVRIDGADVRSVDPASLRRQIAVVTDDPFLFSDTVHNNIAYARAGATREEVVAAAEAAQAAGFIAELPDGYDTRIGERGLTVSGGQRQRIALARAFLADPRILILDDATSAIDASTEHQIQSAMRRVMEGRTTFVIAHRLSTIALADEIVVLEDGRVVAHGSHEQLLEASPLYAEIADHGLPDQVFLTRK
ncbi:MAG: ATP-binding cassette, subfamily bacterial, partial [Solirubrobacteraceae bacterium]|nr:ATP-binding cassette, subfamily bacterial [Solirubrobacteraceae bacterium]